VYCRPDGETNLETLRCLTDALQSTRDNQRP